MEDTQIKPQRNLLSLKTTKGVKLIIINNNLSLHIFKLVRALYHGLITIVTITITCSLWTSTVYPWDTTEKSRCELVDVDF